MIDETLRRSFSAAVSMHRRGQAEADLFTGHQEVDVDPVGLEMRLRQRLEGRRLVCEMGLDETLHREVASVMVYLRDQGIADRESALCTHYPAVVATYLVAEGVYRYEDGKYWPNLTVSALNPLILGPVFERAIKFLGLESFHSLAEVGQRYVTPILAHGGIPRYCLNDFFRLLLDQVRNGVREASELIPHWRAQGNTFNGIDRPVVRFLLHGGDVSVDLLDRCIDLVRISGSTTSAIDPEAMGLPSYICEAYTDLDHSTRRTISSTIGAAIPSPIVRVDPWSTLGPMLSLPAVTGDLVGGSWTLIAAGTAARFDARRDDREIAIAPARDWSVEYSGKSVRWFSFPGLSTSGWLAFSYTNGRLIANPSRFRESTAWILWAGSDDVSVLDQAGNRLRVVEAAPRPTSKWDGYQLAAFDLSDATHLRIGTADPVAIGIRKPGVVVDGASVEGVTVDGFDVPVFSDVPQLRMPVDVGAGLPRLQARIEVDGIAHRVGPDQMVALGSSLLSAFVPSDRSSFVRLLVSGQLGADCRAEFAVVPGLSVVRPDSLMVPGSPPCQIRLSVLGAQIVASVDTGTGAVVVPIAGAAWSLRIAIPTLQWSAWSEGSDRGAMGQSRCAVSASDILEGKQTLLMVRLQRHGVSLRLELRDSRGAVLQVLEGMTGGEEGRWSFDLRKMTSAIRESADPTLRLHIIFGSYDFVVAELRSDIAVSNIKSSEFTTDQLTRLELTFDEDRQLRGRLARLWPLSQPWMPPVEQRIDDGMAGCAHFVEPVERLPPGIYLAQVSVESDWSDPARPRKGAPGTAELRLGAPHGDISWSRALSWAEPLSVVAEAYLEGNAPSEPRPELVAVVGEDAWIALATAAEYADWVQVERKQQALASFLASNPMDATATLVQAVAGRRLSPVQAFTASLAVISQLSPMGAEGGREVLPAAWEICPPLAVAIVLGQAGPGSEDLAMRQAGLTVSLADCEMFPSERELSRYVQFEADQLDAIRRSANLLPRLILDAEFQASAQLEWLLADRRGAFSAKAWVVANRRIADSPAPTEELQRRIRALQPGRLLQAFGPELEFPSTVLAAALHVASRGPMAMKATRALQGLVSVAPGIVSRSVTLSLLLLHQPPG